MDVQAGSCGVDRVQLKVAAIVASTGFMFVMVGGRQVAVTPTVSPQRVSVQAKVVW